MDGQPHPDFSLLARYVPSLPMSDAWLKVYRFLIPSPQVPLESTSSAVSIELVKDPGLTGNPSILSCVARPKKRDNEPIPTRRPAIMWIHGGGMVLENHNMDLPKMKVWVEELGVVSILIGYRLAPEHKALAAVDDTFAGRQWIVHHAVEELGLDIDRLVVAGNSAGGSVAATTMQRIHDTPLLVQPILQLLVYPMLDNRTVLQSDDSVKARIWSPKANRYGWTSYLGCKPGSTNDDDDDIPPYSVAARRTDVTGLPPLWIGVGTLDMF
ncbi:hypothetical protein QFC21_006921 [Naganishia friedmannii]|uniref:Uncharacterized protein n=1 Tax=Naganishia friedmannii TaxID=89922 RepID=A0ACC2UZW0_9TREE|nr:hypothetical protein QFC21_006921 [Naganishia friedmannii]